MTALEVMTAPTSDGWAVYLTDGRELARFRGLFAKQRALRYLAGASVQQSRAGGWSGEYGRFDGTHSVLTGDHWRMRYPKLRTRARRVRH
jgi:hypothetical protein